MRVPRSVFAILISVFLCSFAAAQDARQLRQLGMVDVPGSPGFDRVTMAKGMLVLSHTSANSVDIMDPAKRRIVAQITGLESPRGMALDEAGGKLYVATSGNNSITVIALDGWKVIDTVPLPSAPDAVLLDDGGKRLFWTDSLNDTISVLDLTTRQTVASANVDGQPQDMVLDSDRGLIFVTVQDQREVIALDRKLQVAKRFPLSASQPSGLVYDPRTGHLYVAVRYAVLSISADSGAESNRVPAAAGVDMLWLDPETRTLYAAAPGALLMMRAEGGRLTALDEIATDVKGHTVAYDSEKKMVFLPGGREGRSKLLLLRPMSNNQPDDQTAEAKLHQ